LLWQLVVICMLVATCRSADENPDQVCLSTFYVEKYTMASSDSYRANEMNMLIFPEIEEDTLLISNKTSVPDKASSLSLIPASKSMLHRRPSTKRATSRSTTWRLSSA
jgi:hypothetical protein